MKPVSIAVVATGVALVVGTVWVLGPGARWVLEHIDGVAIGGPAGLAGKDLAAALDAVRGRVLAVATGLAALVAVYYTARNADTARRMFQLGEHGHVTDRYGKAVEQLGSAQAPVRLGGLYALEQLAQDAPGLRQTIVDVICAYLRMPYSPPPDETEPVEPAVPRAAVAGVSAPAAGRDPHEERQVRLTAQRLLTTHLRYKEPPDRRWWRPRTAASNPLHWPDIRLDLNGATLVSLNLEQCRISDADFSRATFTGGTRFNDATFTSATAFTRAKFADYAGFRRARFTSYAWFNGVAFTGHADFVEATFIKDAEFNRATFAGGTWFTDATFTRSAAFVLAKFADYAGFHRATFTGDVFLDKATGLEQAELDSVQIAPPSGGVERRWPLTWRVEQASDGWQTLRKNLPEEDGGTPEVV